MCSSFLSFMIILKEHLLVQGTCPRYDLQWFENEWNTKKNVGISFYLLNLVKNFYWESLEKSIHDLLSKLSFLKTSKNNIRFNVQ